MTKLFALLLLVLLLLPMYAGLRRMRNLPGRPPAASAGDEPEPEVTSGGAQADARVPATTEARDS